MIKKALSIIGMLILALAAWKIFGNNPGEAITGIGDFLWMIIQAGSDIVVNIVNTIFHR